MRPPHLGVNDDWIANLVDAVAALEPFSAGRGMAVDRTALAEQIACPATQFVKWDCRSDATLRMPRTCFRR